MVEIARTLNPRIAVAVRTHSDEEAARLIKENVGKVFHGESELASGMARYVLGQLRPSPQMRDSALAPRAADMHK